MNEHLLDINATPADLSIEEVMSYYQDTGISFIDSASSSSATITATGAPIIYGTAGGNYEMYNPPHSNRVIWNSINEEEVEEKEGKFLGNIEK